MSQALFTLAPTQMGAAVKPTARINQNTGSRSGVQMKGSMPTVGHRSMNNSKYVPSASNISRSGADVQMSAKSISASSNGVAKSQRFGGLSMSAAMSGNDYTCGQAMSMNADTSKWGRMTGGSSFTSNDFAGKMGNMASQARGINMKAQASASASEYSFNVSGSSMNVMKNHFGGA